jgi:hypothetical protein
MMDMPKHESKTEALLRAEEAREKVAAIEAALRRDPRNQGLQVRLMSAMKIANRYEEKLLK